MKDRMSHNVSIISGIVDKPERYKGKLTIKLNSFGSSYDDIKGGGYHEQGGIVFDNEELALEVLNGLQEYFGHSKLTVRKEISSFAYDIYKRAKLKLWHWRWKGKNERKNT